MTLDILIWLGFVWALASVFVVALCVIAGGADDRPDFRPQETPPGRPRARTSRDRCPERGGRRRSEQRSARRRPPGEPIR